MNYPIFRDFSENRRMRKQCVPGVLFLRPSSRTPGYEVMETLVLLCLFGATVSIFDEDDYEATSSHNTYREYLINTRARAFRIWCMYMQIIAVGVTNRCVQQKTKESAILIFRGQPTRVRVFSCYL